MVSTGVLVAVGAVDFEPAVLLIADDPQVHVVRRCVDVADLVATAASRQAGAALVSAHLRGLDAEVVDRLRESEVAVVGVLAEVSSADEAQLRQIGIDYVASADDVVSLAEAVLEAVRTPTPSAVDGAGAERLATLPNEQPALRSGRVIAVWGPNGAPGRSTLALGLSAELAESGTPTLLIDADVYGGAIAPMLGLLDESSGLLAAARSANSGTLTAESLAGHARQVTPHLRVLSGLPRADRWTEVKAVLLRHILEASRCLVPLTVVDCGFSLEFDEEISYDTTAPRRNGATVATLERADVVVVVGSADPVSLSRLIRGVSDLKTVLPSVTTRLVVNRVRPSLGWSDDEILSTVARATGISAVRLLPDDPAACDRALVHGKTLAECAPDARLSKALRVLADQFGEVASDNRRRRRSLLRRWR